MSLESNNSKQILSELVFLLKENFLSLRIAYLQKCLSR